MFLLQNSADNMSDENISQQEVSSIISRGKKATVSDIDITVWERGKHLKINLVYNVDVYDNYMAEGMLLHFKQLLNALLDNEEFVQYYYTRYMDLMNTAFQEEEMINLVEEIENSISFDMNHHFLRWGGYSIQWHNNVNNVKNFISDRIDYIPEGMNSCYDLTGPFSLTLDVYPQDAGKIQINSIEIESSDYPWTGDYHGQIEMIIKATQEDNFNHWEINNHEIIDLNAANISLMLTEDDTLRAVFNEQNTLDILVINGVRYVRSFHWVMLFDVLVYPCCRLS